MIKPSFWEAHKTDLEWLTAERARKAQVAKRWRLSHTEEKKADNRKRYKDKPWYFNAFHRKNLASMPPWADRMEIETIYKMAYEQRLEVDHIHPLNGKGLCGLHVPHNLQLLSRSDNCRKGKKFATS